MRTLPFGLLAAAVSLGACTSSTAIRSDQDADAVDAAAQFQSLAEDALRNGADPDVFNAYRDIGTAVSRNGRVSPITVVVDGTPLEFLATAEQIELVNVPPCPVPGSLQCPGLPPLRSLIAWQKGNPRRVVQLATTGPGAAISSPVAGPVAGGIPNVATLTYFDGTGGAYVSTSGSQSINEPETSDSPCATYRLPPGAVSAPELGHCTRAEFTVSFSGTVAPPPFAVRGNTASGTHAVAMTTQPVHGARIQLPSFAIGCPGCTGYPSPFLPPVKLGGGALRAAMTATVSQSLVTFQLRITNPQTSPVTIQFNSGQQYDVRVRRADGSTVWVWSADKLFTAALTSRMLAAGETVTFTATWTPTEHGAFLAEGRLTSTSHAAASTTALTIP